MTPVFGYVRVSTAKQGEGVSLTEQRHAIEQYGLRHDLRIVRWFEEKQTAAKRGRPVFTSMLRHLRAGPVRGLVIHKIDRSARNLRDWADLGDLMDAGVAVHFAHESLDLKTRGGRLSADLQAVVASDYIRNLSEETKKGHRGRLKQGIYPFPAPLGYLNNGRGRLKTHDPVQGPLVREAFELYATGGYSLQALSDLMHERGLRTKGGKRVFKSKLATIFRDPFYMGTLRLKTSVETFPGKHDPLVSRTLFEKVGAVLDGKTAAAKSRHDYLFRRLFTCGHCARFLVGERQKGRVYYRCHEPGCPSKTVREDRITTAVEAALEVIALSDQELERARQRHDAKAAGISTEIKQARSNLTRDLGNVSARLERLLRGFLDGAVDQTTYQDTRAQLESEQRGLRERITTLAARAAHWEAHAREKLELLNKPLLSYETGTAAEKRDLVRIVSSNRTLTDSELAVELAFPFSAVAETTGFSNGCPLQNVTRTPERLDFIVDAIWESARRAAEELERH